MTTEQLDPLEYMTKVEKDFAIYFKSKENSCGDWKPNLLKPWPPEIEEGADVIVSSL